MHSQRDEEPVILANAPSVGRYCDIGAYDGITFSNTRALSERGWSGVLIEPSPESFAGLMKNSEPYRSRLDLVNALVVPHRNLDSGLVRFYANPDAVATTEEKHKAKWEHAVKFTPIWVAAISIAEIISHFKPPFDFINIDTEGTSGDVLKAISLDAVGCNLICVEKDENRDSIIAHLESAGKFKVFHETAENLIARRIQ